METKNKISPLKGKNYEEIFGIEKAKEMREKRSLAMKKLRKEEKIIPWNKGTKGLTTGWAKGLTKKTDERIRKLAEKTSNTRKRLGLAKGENNPMKKKEIAKKVGQIQREKGIYILKSEMMKIKNPSFLLKNREKISQRNKINNPMNNPNYKQKMIDSNRKNGCYEKHRQRQFLSNSCKYVKNPSKPQKEIYEKIKKLFWFTPVLINYKIKKEGNGFYYLDVALPQFFLNFEYDGKYWHSLERQIEKDKKRDEYLTRMGWHIYRVEGD